MTAALITEAGANPREYVHLATELSRDCVQALRTAGPEITRDGGDPASDPAVNPSRGVTLTPRS